MLIRFQVCGEFANYKGERIEHIKMNITLLGQFGLESFIVVAPRSATTRYSLTKLCLILVPKQVQVLSNGLNLL